MIPGLIGIDLGTCFSAVGYRGPHGVTFLKDPGAPQLSYSIPSSMLVRPDGRVIFGALAESEKSVRPEYYQAQFKRDLGSRVPYQLGSLTISSAEITQKFLSFLVELATAAMGRAPTGGVITVPSDYDAFRCSLVETAALAAGLPAVHLVPEPVAALVAAADRDELPREGIVLVYDLGGGTFDAALVRVEGATREVLATRGLADFGGTDIDRMIEADLALKAGAEFAELLAGGSSDDPRTRSRALRARIGARDLCRDVKHRLSNVELVQTDLFLRVQYELSRDELVDMVRPELERTLATCHRLLADASLTDQDVSGVLLTGGGSRMPIVLRLLQQSIERPVWPASDPEMVVCAGATVLAQSRAANPAPPARANPGLVGNESAVSATGLPSAAEEVYRASGLDALSKVLQAHIDRVTAVRANHQLDDADLLSARVKHNQNIPRDVRESAAALHARIQSVVQQVAGKIEDARYREVEAGVSEIDGNMREREKAKKLVRIDKEMHVAYETLRLTIEFFGDLNQTVVRRISEEEASSSRLSNMMFGNAVLIYEITDFVIGYIKTFVMGNEHVALHEEAVEWAQRIRHDDAELETTLAEDNIDQEVRRFTIEDIHDRAAALDELERQWDRYLDEIHKLHALVYDVQGRVPTLEVIRENAHNQIAVLQATTMLRFLRRSSNSIRGAVETVQGLRLAPLSSERVRALVGVVEDNE